MRRAALAVALAVSLSSYAVAGVTGPAYAAGTTPLAFSNANPYVGQTVTLTGALDTPPPAGTKVTIQSDRGGFQDLADVALQPDGVSFSYLTSTTAPARTFRALVKGSAVVSDPITLTTRSVESVDRSAAPAATDGNDNKIYKNEPFAISGTAGTVAGRDVHLQRNSGCGWVDINTQKTVDAGAYSFTNIITTADLRILRIYVPPTDQDPIITSPLTLKPKTNTLGLVLTRVDNGSALEGNAFVSSKAAAGRSLQLQKASGSSWSNVGSAVALAQDQQIVKFSGLATGTVYRLSAGAGSDGAPETVSSGTSMAGTGKSNPSSLSTTPALYVTTLGGSFPKSKGPVYSSTAKIEAPGADEDLAVNHVEEFGVRGNSSASYPKQGYKIKFDKTSSPVGLPAGKTFNLLPDYQDRSLVRTAVGIGHVAENVVNRGTEWTPNRKFVQLYINGNYRGAFDLTESIKIEKGSSTTASRVPVDPERGVIIEIDPYGAEDGVPHWTSSKSSLPFKFKDPDEYKLEDDGCTEDPTGIDRAGAKYRAIKAKVDRLESALYSGNGDWRDYLDANSAVDFYLTKEFIKDWDGDFYRSNFFYTNDVFDPNSKLIMAPIWDVDRSAGAKTSGTSSVMSPKGWWMNGDGGGHLNNSDNVHTKHWFVKIAKTASFKAALKARWNSTGGNGVLVRKYFEYAGAEARRASAEDLTYQVAANDRALWASTGDAKRYAPHSSTYSGEISFVANWYDDRYAWMNAQIQSF